MNIQELVKSSSQVMVIIGLDDLRLWHKEVIEDTRRELEEIVISDKSETYPTPKEVSKILGVDLSTLWRWNKRKYLVHIEIGGKRKYKMSDVKSLLNGTL